MTTPIVNSIIKQVIADYPCHIKIHNITSTSTSISELIKHLSVRIKIKHIYIRASKCIITLQIILCKTMLTVNSSIYYVPSMYLVFFFSVKFLLIAIIYIQYITILQTVLNRRRICEFILTASKSICICITCHFIQCEIVDNNNF